MEIQIERTSSREISGSHLIQQILDDSIVGVLGRSMQLESLGRKSEVCPREG